MLLTKYNSYLQTEAFFLMQILYILEITISLQKREILFV
jgi:hypothetical protein